MTKAEYFKQIESYGACLARQSGSTGSTGKLMDELIRRAILDKGLHADCRVGCRGGYQVDARSAELGVVEIKTGSGAVNYAKNRPAFSADERTPENVFPGVDLIVWYPFPKVISWATLFTAGWVFTREQFIEMLERIGKHGLQSSLKLAAGGYQINIQTISAKLEERLWDVLDTTPTLDQLIPEKRQAEIREAYTIATRAMRG